MIELNKDLFKLRKNKFESVEDIAGESLTFWQDARKRLLKNKMTVAALIIIAFIIVMSIFAPLISPYDYDVRVMSDKALSTKIPPRIPVIEKLGIFDGQIRQQISVDTFNALDEETKQYYEIIGDKEEAGVDYYITIQDTYALKGIEDKYFIFGTDDQGRDLWTRLWYGTRISLYIGLLAAFLDMSIGVVYGGIAGYFGGTKIDTLMMRFTEIVGGIPSLVILSLFLLVMDPGLLAISLAIGITGWMSAARVVRSQFLKLKDQEFVLASRTLGAGHKRLIFKHLFPNVIGQMIVMITFTIPSAIFYEAFLAFIGLGLPAPMPSIGRLCENGYEYMKTYPYMLFIPTALICLLMLSINIFSNGLRDALDPKMR